MNDEDQYFRTWLGEIVDAYRPDDPKSAEPLLVASDRLFELGDLFGSSAIRALAEGSIRKASIRVPHKMIDSPMIAYIGHPHIHIMLSHLDFMETPEGIASLLIASEFPGAVSINPAHIGFRLKEIFGSPILGKVESLSIHGPGLSPRTIDELVGSPLAHRLRRLELDRVELEPADVRTLTRGPFEQLEILMLRSNLIGNDAIELLAGAAALGNLRALDLAENQIGNAGARALARSRTLAYLQWLDLSGNMIGHEGALEFGATDALLSLRGLDLRRNTIHDPELAASVQSMRVGPLDLLLMDTTNPLGVVQYYSLSGLGTIRDILATGSVIDTETFGEPDAEVPTTPDQPDRC